MKIVVFICILVTSFNTVNSVARCPKSNTIGYFPKCDCEGENIGYNFEARKCQLMCPSMSEGVLPNCTCRYGGIYDNVTNSCPNPKCPKNTTIESIYPNCKCTGSNYEYNEYLNECYLVCPEESTGHFPECKCHDELKGFNKELFQCMQCPEESTVDSLYPNCKAENQNATYNPLFNEFRVCHPGSNGKYPHCTCENGNVYKAEDSFHGWFYGWRKAGCFNCPLDLEGNYPKCECPDDEVFDGEECRRCPWNGFGVYPNCTCETGTFNEINECRACPFDSTGIYPNCVCDHPLTFRKDWNRCMRCPGDSIGIYPNCTCIGEKAGFEPKYARCYECPDESTGRHPNCTCEKEGYAYETYLRYCGKLCEDGVSIYPNCKCETFYKHFLNKTTLKCMPFAYDDRPCPPNAFGTSPNCHCLQDYHFFIPYGWGCFKEYSMEKATISCKDPKCSQFITTNGVEQNAFLQIFW